MSLWQRKNIHKQHLLWLKLYGVCSLFHCAILVWVFFVHDNDVYHVSLSLNKQIDYSAPILFMPVGSKEATPAPQPATQHNSSLITIKTEQPSEEPITATTFTAAPEQQIPKTNIPTPPSTQQEKKEPQKKPQEKKKTSDNPHVAQQAEQPLTAVHKPTSPTTPDNAHISHNYKEVEALRRTALLQKDLLSHWKPPIGIPPHTTCEVTFFVDTQGIIKNISMSKSSGILMYDISARQALFSMTMPQWTYNKTITINFT